MANFDFGDERKAKLDMATGEYVEILGKDENGDTIYGKRFKNRREWDWDVQNNRLLKLEDLKASRDPTSDLQNLPGRKGNFYDDWSERGDQFVQVPGSNTVVGRPPLSNYEVS